MKARIIKIGNSKGVRIPKVLLEQSNLAEEVEIEAHDGQILIRQPSSPRRGWAEQFRKMAERCDDKLLEGRRSILTQWQENEWQW